MPGILAESVEGGRVSRSRPLAWVAVLAGLLGAGCEQAPFGGADQDRPDRLSSGHGLEPARVARGQVIYERHCLKCHGESGRGTVLDWRIRDADGHLPPPPLNGRAQAALQPASALLATIREGSPAGEGKMPGWKGTLSERDMQDVLAYIQSLWSAPVYRLWLTIEARSQKKG